MLAFDGPLLFCFSGLPERVSAFAARFGPSKGLVIVWLKVEQGKVDVGAKSGSGWDAV